MSWKWILTMILPIIESAGWAKVNEDDNDTGKDDIIGQSILYGVKLFKAIVGNDTATLNKMLPTEAKTLVSKKDFHPPSSE